MSEETKHCISYRFDQKEGVVYEKVITFHYELKLTEFGYPLLFRAVESVSPEVPTQNALVVSRYLAQ